MIGAVGMNRTSARTMSIVLFQAYPVAAGETSRSVRPSAGPGSGGIGRRALDRVLLGIMGLSSQSARLYKRGTISETGWLSYPGPLTLPFHSRGRFPTCP